MHHEFRDDNRESAVMRCFGNVFIKVFVFFQRSALKRNQVRKSAKNDRHEAADKVADTKTDVRLKRPEHHIPYPHYFK